MFEKVKCLCTVAHPITMHRLMITTFSVGMCTHVLHNYSVILSKQQNIKNNKTKTTRYKFHASEAWIYLYLEGLI